MTFDSSVLVNSDTISKIIRNLSTGKCCGPDGLVTEHYKFCGQRINHMLALLFTSIFTHGFIPSEMTDSVLVPIIKKIKLVTLLTRITIVQLVFLLYVLDRFEKYVVITDNQFGFKRCHSTETCIFLLKEIL